MISIRLSKQTEEDLKKIAEFEGMTISEYVRNIISEKLEDVYDLKIGEEALFEYEKDKKTYSFDEVFDR